MNNMIREMEITFLKSMTHIQLDYIPNNYRREITRGEFTKLITDYSIKYIR